MPTEITFDASGLSQRMRQAAFRGVVRGTEMVRAEMIRLIQQGPKTGRVYGRRQHRASAPGEAPATDTGRLVGTIRTSYDMASLTGKVTIGIDYGLMLEFGTQTMEPRPFARPALANMQQAIAKAIAEEIGHAGQ